MLTANLRPSTACNAADTSRATSSGSERQVSKSSNWRYRPQAVIQISPEAAIQACCTSVRFDEHTVHGDAGYQGADKRPENEGVTAEWHIAMKRGKRKALPKDEMGTLLDRFEWLKASIRAKVEHPFHVVKNLFRHRKVRYRGLAKNEAQLFSLFGFANLVLARKRLFALDGVAAP